MGYFVLLTWYWEIITVLGFPRVYRPQTTWGGWILTLHIKYAADSTNPFLFLFEQTHHYPVDDQRLLPLWLCCLGESKVCSASLVRVLRAVPIWIPNRNRNRVCTSHTQCVKFVMVTKCHNYEFVTSVTRSGFFLVILVKQIWSHFGHKCHKWSRIKMWLVQTCFGFCFNWNGSQWMKYCKTYPWHKMSSVSVFSLESGSERLLVVVSLMICWVLWSQGLRNPPPCGKATLDFF